jgi:hypothetical protein
MAPSTPSFSAVVSYSWSGNQAPSRVSFQAILSLRLHTPGAAVEWLLIWQSPPIVCGPNIFSNKQIIPGTGRHPLDGWVRILLHAPGDEHECYAFADVPSAALVAPTAHQQTMAVGDSLLRVSICAAPPSPDARAASASANFTNIDGTLPQGATSPTNSTAVALARRISPSERNHLSSTTTSSNISPPSRLDDATLGAPPHSHTGGASTATSMVGFSSVSASSNTSPKRLDFLTNSSPATSPNLLLVQERDSLLHEARTRIAHLEGEITVLNAAKNNNTSSSLNNLKNAHAEAHDATARAAREIKMRLAMDARRVAAEERCVELMKSLREVEMDKLAAAEAAATSSSRGGGVNLGGNVAATAAAVQAATLAAVTSTATATIETLRAALVASQAQSASLASTLEMTCQAANQVCQMTTASVATFGPLTIPSRDLSSLASSYKFDAISVRALSNKMIPAVKAVSASMSRGDMALISLCNYSALQAAASETCALHPRLVENWKRCVDFELATRHAVERGKDDSAAATVTSLEERANLVREWEAYSQHWEQRGREAERVVSEWEKAHKSVVRSRDDTIAELNLVRGQLDSSKAYLQAIGHGAASLGGGGGGKART